VGDTITPFVLNAPAGLHEPPHRRVQHVLPAKTARVEHQRQDAEGQVWAEMRGDRQSSSACLACRNVVKPRG